MNTMSPEALAGARQALQHLLSLPENLRHATLNAVENFDPSSPTIHRDEIAALARQSNTNQVDLWAATRLVLFTLAEPQWQTLLGGDVEAAQDVFDKMMVLGAALDRKFSRAAKIARGMPTFMHCTISCDLRMVSGGPQETLDLAPIALVRIELDEEEHDTTFQCTPQSLTRLIEALEQARDTLSWLEQNAPGKVVTLS